MSRAARRTSDIRKPDKETIDEPQKACWLANALVQLQARYHPGGDAASEKCLSAARSSGFRSDNPSPALLANEGTIWRTDEILCQRDESSPASVIDCAHHAHGPAWLAIPEYLHGQLVAATRGPGDFNGLCRDSFKRHQVGIGPGAEVFQVRKEQFSSFFVVHAMLVEA
jgi:hypothetical protein